MATAAGDLIVRLGAQTRQFDSKMKHAQSVTGRFRGAVGGLSKGLIGLGAAFAGVAGARAMGRMVKRNLDLLDSAGKLSDRLGIATEKLMGLRHAAELTGAGADTLDAGLTTMAKRLGEAARGAGAAKPALEHIGLAIGDIIALSPDQQFIAIGEAISKLGTHTERAAIAANIFSKGNMKLINLLAEGRKGITAMQAEAERLGITFDRGMAAKAELANDALTRLSAVMRGAMIKSTADLSPLIEKLATDLGDVLPAATGKLSTAFLHLQKVYTSAFAGLATSLDALAQRPALTAVLFGPNFAATLAKNSTALNAWVDESRNQIAELDAALSGKLPKGARAPTPAGMPGLGAGGGDGAAISAPWERAQQIIKAMESPVEKYRRQVEELQRLGASGALGGNLTVFNRQLQAYRDELARATAVSNPARDAIGDLAEQVFRLSHGLTEGGIALREFGQLPGVSPDMLRRFGQLQGHLDKLQKSQGLRDFGEQLRRQLMTPAEDLEARLGKILEAFQAGAITREMAGRAFDAERQQLRGPGAAAGAPQFAGAAEKGSPEAFSRIVQAVQGGGGGPAKDTAKNTAKMVRLLDRATAALQSIDRREVDQDVTIIPR